MPTRSVLLPSFVLILAFGLTPPSASADPVRPCSSSSVRLALYGPCVLWGAILLDNLTANVGGTDLTNDPQLAMTVNFDAHPPEVRWLVFNYPAAGAFGAEVTRDTPLEVGYRMTALNGAMIRLVDVAIINHELFGSPNFRGLVEWSLTLESGDVRLLRLGWDDGSFLGERRVLALNGVRSMTVLTRVFSTSMHGGGGPGLFAAATDPEPVPEPASMVLLGTGLAWLTSRLRARHSTALRTGRRRACAPARLTRR